MVETPAIFFIDPVKLPNFPKRRIPICRGKVKKNQPKTKTYTKRTPVAVLFRFNIDNYSHSMLRFAHRRCQGLVHADMPPTLATVMVSSWGDSWGAFSPRVVLASQRPFRTATHFFDEARAVHGRCPSPPL
ncbi:hypothetical protein [Comamonas sp.]|uniref:hypothetical protein n=1 Tax=Comamonas sp. TaxID=34028 RepID=UPI00289B99CE|nr:hypothetical protein [Comamonas sp.]